MRKLYCAVPIVLVGLLVSLFLFSRLTEADSDNPWLSSSLKFAKEPDTQSFPATFGDYGNIDCSQVSFGCSVSTLYGTVTNGAVELNGLDDPYPILSYLENRPRVIPVPNSNTAISYLTTPVFGLYFYFNHNFSSSLILTFVPGTNQRAYKINLPPDGAIADKSGALLAADINSMSFSTNARWMVVSIPNVAVARVNMQTFEVLPFAAKFNYGISLPPDARTAITNDGRYAVVASKNQSRFLLYDLDTCAPVPNTISGPVSCQSRDLGGFMKQQFSGFDSVIQARFFNEDLLSAYATYSDNGVLKTARFLISNTNIASQIDYLALGDSFISGEGAFNYQEGTDTNDNRCHLSLVSYPYLIGAELSYGSYNSVACSGALMDDITNYGGTYRGQVNERRGLEREERTQQEIDSIFASFKPGYINQSDFVSRYRPAIINLSIGGNDIGFSKIVTKCAAPWNIDNCYESYEDRLELARLINSKFKKLAGTYKKVKNQAAPNSRLYIIGYPQIAKSGGDCDINVWLSDSEIRFAELITQYLNTVIKAAADNAGVYYVDVEDAFSGYRLCEGTRGSVAVNGLKAGNDIPRRLGGPIGNESYHPNALGHRLLKIKILDKTNNLTSPMPSPNLSAAPPAENGLAILDTPKSGRAVNATRYAPDMVNDLIYIGTPANVTIKGYEFALAPNAALRAELQSDPIELGNYTTDQLGNLETQITVPASATAGYHTLHFYGTDLSGQKIDIYKDVYIALSQDDLDGNGIADSSQACIGVPALGEDFDKDGIDDACDGNITQPPEPSLSQPAEGQASAFATASNLTPSSPASVSRSVNQGLVLQNAGSLQNSYQTAQPAINVDDSAPQVLGGTAQNHQNPASGGNQALKSGSMLNDWPITSALLALTLVGLLSLFWHWKKSKPGREFGAAAG